jgi:hypothetical protein
MSALLRIAVPARADAPGGPPPASMTYFIALLMAILLIARHYSIARRVQKGVPGAKEAPDPIKLLPVQDVDLLNRNEPTAVFLIGGRDHLGPLTLRTFAQHHAQAYRQVLFLAVGVADASAVDASHHDWKGYLRTAEAKRLKDLTRLALDPYVESAHELGFKSDCRISIATDPAKEIGLLAGGIAVCYSRAMFFVGKLVFEQVRWYHLLLHSRTADSIRQSLERRGIPVTVIPVVVDANALKSAERN